MRTGLLLIDIQNDYFPGGAMELVGIEEAVDKAGRALRLFREKGWPVFHVQHIRTRPDAGAFMPGTRGAEIHASVRPLPGECVIQKHFANSFRETSLLAELKRAGIEGLVICGAMSHMCVDAATRAAADFGFECIVVHDACATRDLVFNEVVVPAVHVHSAMMAALAFAYARVLSATELESELTGPN